MHADGRHIAARVRLVSAASDHPPKIIHWIVRPLVDETASIPQVWKVSTLTHLAKDCLSQIWLAGSSQLMQLSAELLVMSHPMFSDCEGFASK